MLFGHSLWVCLWLIVGLAERVCVRIWLLQPKRVWLAFELFVSDCFDDGYWLGVF